MENLALTFFFGDRWLYFPLVLAVYQPFTDEFAFGNFHSYVHWTKYQSHIAQTFWLPIMIETPYSSSALL
jgi:hypothetical protein